MENASKALIMGAEILFGVILLTLFVGAYYSWNNFAGKMNNNIESAKIQEFNSKFTIYDKKVNSNAPNLTTHDVISTLNFINEYNKTLDDDYNKVEIISNFNVNENDISKFISENEGKVFTLDIMKYDKATGRVKIIKITKK